jgi:hypothetical protein
MNAWCKGAIHVSHDSACAFYIMQDFNLTNTRIVSSGTDNSIKIWAIDTPEMKTAMEVRRKPCRARGCAS